MSNIVTDGLIGYWHYKKGFNGNAWDNIAPETKGKFNGIVNGAILSNDGVFFDGVDDFILIENLVKNNSSIALEVFYYHNINGVGGNQSSMGAYPINAYKNTNFRLTSQKHNGGNYSYGDNTNNSFHNLSGSTKITDFQWHQVLYQYNHETIRKELYVNGKLDSSASILRDWKDSFNLRIACNHINGINTVFTNGMYACVRLYDRALTTVEIQQNYTVGKEIGLSVEPVKIPPIVLSVTADKLKISDEPSMSQSIITVRFDKNVTEYVARLNGFSHSTGALVHQGSAVSANTDAQVVIDWDELSSEGQNKINIYGKSEDGIWTEFQD